MPSSCLHLVLKRQQRHCSFLSLKDISKECASIFSTYDCNPDMWESAVIASFYVNWELWNNRLLDTCKVWFNRIGSRWNRIGSHVHPWIALDCQVKSNKTITSKMSFKSLLAFAFLYRAMRVPCDGCPPTPKPNGRAMRFISYFSRKGSINRRTRGTPQLRNPRGGIARLF